MLSIDELLQNLDPQQRAAALCLRGPLAIRAGAGSGKTRTITHRIAYGVASGVYNPEKVLALTYTKKAAAELRQRLAELGAAGVTARTFHSLALEQLHEFWNELIGGKHPEPLSNTKKQLLVQKALQECALVAPEGALADVLAEIEWRKVTMLSIGGYRTSGRQGAAGFSAMQLAEIMHSYEEIKIALRAIDFEDVIALTAGMIEAERFIAERVRRRFQHFTVDEYQDISPLQHTLLHAWLGDNSNICVVGDASQTIFSFAGANQGFLLNFGKEFPDAEIIELQRSYRSTPAIIECANRLMHDEPGAIQLVANPLAGLTGAAARGDKVIAAWFQTPEKEALAIANAIKEQISLGADPQTIAVLARTNLQLEEFAKYLRANGVAAKLQTDPGMFAYPTVKKAIIALRVAATEHTDKTVTQQIADVLQAAGYSSKPLTDKEAELARQQLEKFGNLLEKYAQNRSLAEVAGLVQQMLIDGVDPDEDEVTLLPIHSAKGLEWDTVYLLGASEGKLPIKQSLNNAQQLAEEKRLTYVAFTRAKRLLRISLSGGQEDILGHSLDEAPQDSHTSTKTSSGPSRFLRAAGIKVRKIT